MGADFDLERVAPAFFPNGGGKIAVRIRGGAPLSRIEILHRGDIGGRFARARVSDLPISIAHRELIVVQRKLDWPWTEMQKERVKGFGPGNVLALALHHGGGVSMFTGFGEKGLASEEVAEAAVGDVLEIARLVSSRLEFTHLSPQCVVTVAQQLGCGVCTIWPDPGTPTGAQCRLRDTGGASTTGGAGGGGDAECANVGASEFVTITSMEDVQTIPGGAWGMAECAL